MSEAVGLRSEPIAKSKDPYNLNEILALLEIRTMRAL